MTWSPFLSQGFESDKIWPLVIPYARGRGLDMGCGPRVCLPHMIGVDAQAGAAVKAEADDLDWVADESLDFIFSSHLLEHIDPERVPDVLALWAKKLKFGGHLITYLPDADEYPRMGEPGANPDHRWDPLYGNIWSMLVDQKGHTWRRLEAEKRNKYNEYSLFEVCQKVRGQMPREEIRQRNPGGKLRALVFRLGAVGDCVVAASVLPGLKEKGYHVTCLTSPVGEQILQNNPNVDDLIVAEKEMFWPGQALRFTEFMNERYDKVVNLDRSLEGLALMREENYGYDYPPETRRWLYGNINYYDVAQRIAGVELTDAPCYFRTDEEIAWARNARTYVDGPCVVWQVTGSSFYKVYPAMNRVCAMLADAGVRVVFTGGAGNDQQLEQAVMQAMHDDGIDTTMFHPQTGRWPLRKTIAFAMEADCVVGPETGLMHAVGPFNVPQVVYLSHSSPENLTRNWRLTISLRPPENACPCHPCHRIHTVHETCNFDEERGGALCMTTLEPEKVYRAIMSTLAHKVEIDDS